MTDAHQAPAGSARRRRVAVVGAGPAGLEAARRCADAGDAVDVFEKSRGIGGRVATRRARAEDGSGADLAFDHGAPAFRPRSPFLRAHFDTLAAAGAAVRATPPFEGYIGVPSMTALFRALADGLDIAFETRVERLERLDDGRWRLSTAATARGAPPVDEAAWTARGPYDAVVIAVPGPQARALAGAHAAPEIAAAMDAATYAPQLTLMLAVPAGARGWGDGPAARVWEDGPLALAFRNDLRPGRPGEHVQWVAQASAAFTGAHLEDPADAVADRMHAVLADALGADASARPAYRRAHRWRYSRTTHPVPYPDERSAPRSLSFAGDWLGAPGARRD
ncbi:MAG: FAD-dependent oxidoreductase [Pseudomonadota bacterium]